MKTMKFLVLFVISFCAFLTHESKAFESNIYRFDDPQNAKGLHVRLEGSNWAAREVTKEDIPFHVTLFNIPKVMSKFTTGEVRTPEATREKLEEHFSRLEAGHPHGGLTVLNHDPKPIGFTVVTPGDEPGTAQIAQLYSLESQGQGLGSSVRKAIVDQLTPEIRRIGLGRGLDADKDAKIIKAFQCFQGEPLRLLFTTVRPSNVASCRIQDKTGFKAAAANILDPIDFDKKEMDGDTLEAMLMSYFDASADTPLQADIRYRLIDSQGIVRTFSKNSQYGCISYHFEYVVPDPT